MEIKIGFFLVTVILSISAPSAKAIKCFEGENADNGTYPMERAKIIECDAAGEICYVSETISNYFLDL